MDYRDPETIVTAGAAALIDQAEAGVQLTAVLGEKDSSIEAISLVDNLEEALHEKFVAIQQEIDRRAGRGEFAQEIGKHPIGRKVLNFIDKGVNLLPSIGETASQLVDRGNALISRDPKKSLEKKKTAWQRSDQAMFDLMNGSAEQVEEVMRNLAMQKNVPPTFGRTSGISSNSIGARKSKFISPYRRQRVHAQITVATIAGESRRPRSHRF